MLMRVGQLAGFAQEAGAPQAQPEPEPALPLLDEPLPLPLELELDDEPESLLEEPLDPLRL
jgi:hypothetical protein